jgi:hypothetical protein
MGQALKNGRRWLAAALVALGVLGSGLGSQTANAETVSPWLDAVGGVRCVHRAPWICEAPTGTFPLTLTLGSAGVAYVQAHDWLFDTEGTTASISLGTLQVSLMAAGTPVHLQFDARGAGVVTLSFGQTTPPLTIYVGSPPLPAWPGVAHIVMPTANVRPPLVFAGPLRSAQTMENAYLKAIVHAHGVEKTPAFRLPRNFAHLTRTEQVFVLTNLERVTRGLWPLWGMTQSLDAIARAGAENHADPVDPSATTSWASNWFSGTDPAQAMFGWMYQDGPGAWGENLDCPTATASGCWGHRRNVLGDFGPFGLLGAADLAAGGTTEIMLWSAAPPRTGVVYTWAQAVKAGARPAN